MTDDNSDNRDVCHINNKNKPPQHTLEGKWKGAARCIFKTEASACPQIQTSEIPKEEGLPLEEAYRYSIFCASLMGLHLMNKDADGNLLISRLKVASSVIFTFVCLLAMVFTLYPLVFGNDPLPFWYMVMMLPYLAGSSFCIFVYMQSARQVRTTKSYIEAIRPLRVPFTLKTRLLMLSGFIYPIVITGCSLIMIPGWNEWISFIPISVMCFVPAVFDIYMSAFVLTLHNALMKLRKKVCSCHLWTSQAVHMLAHEWLHLARLLDSHNQVFRTRVSLRLVVLITQAMAHLFMFWALQDFHGDCVAVVATSTTSLVEVLLRLKNLCCMGQKILTEGEAVLESVREAAYSTSVGTPAHDAFIVLTARLEASPPAVCNWGMDSLSSRTQVTLMKVMATFLVVLLQFCSYSYSTNINNLERNHTSLFTAYDHCFVPVNISTTSNVASWA